MKPLSKLPEPQILKSNGASWTAAYVSASSEEERRKRERWRHPQIKEALKLETGSKCAYCEGVVDDVSFPHVEHIRPKGKYPELAHDWCNLTTACERCNVAKSDYSEPGLELINPYVDDVLSHLRALGPMVDWSKGDQRAELTVSRLKLNRAELVAARTGRMLSIRSMIERWHGSEGPHREALQSAICLDATEGEFSQSVIWFLREHRFPI
jgi:uncharacterized protein (TIGR02646 family)